MDNNLRKLKNIFYNDITSFSEMSGIDTKILKYLNSTSVITAKASMGHPTLNSYHQAQLRIVLIPILSCIFGFPVLVLLLICGLRYRARRARKLHSKIRRQKASIGLEKGPVIVINGCDEQDDLVQRKEMLVERQKLSLLSVRFKNLTEIDDERSDFDAEMTSDFILTPEESSTTMSS